MNVPKLTFHESSLQSNLLLSVFLNIKLLERNVFAARVLIETK